MAIYSSIYKLASLVWKNNINSCSSESERSEWFASDSGWRARWFYSINIHNLNLSDGKGKV